MWFIHKDEVIVILNFLWGMFPKCLHRWKRIKTPMVFWTFIYFMTILKKVLSFTMQWFNKNTFCKIITSYDLTFFFWLYHSRWKGTNNNDNFKCMVYLQETLWILHGRTIIYQYHPEKLLHSLWFLNVQRNNSTLCELCLCLFMNYWKNCVGVGGWVWIFVSVSVHDFTMD